MRTDISDTELSYMLNRSIKSIQIKRSRMRKLYDVPTKASKSKEEGNMARHKKQETLELKQENIELAINGICDMMRDSGIGIVEMVCAMNAVKAGVAMQIKANLSDDETVRKSLEEIKSTLDCLLEVQQQQQ